MSEGCAATWCGRVLDEARRRLQQWERDGHRLGEPVSQECHALQTFEWLRTHAPGRPLLWLAGLVHDIGHNPENDPTHSGVNDHHERHAAELLARLGAPRDVVRPVELHTEAKRYLAGRDKSYWDALTPASRASLALQGGPMSRAERAAFDADEFARDALLLRGGDDGGKDLHPKHLPSWDEVERALAGAGLASRGEA